MNKKELVAYSPKGLMSRVDLSVKDEYSVETAIHELIQDGIQYGGAKIFQFSYDQEKRVISYTDDSKNFPEDAYKSYRENYISHVDSHSVINNDFSGVPGKKGCGGKDAIRYLCSEEGTSYVTEYITTPDGNIKMDYRTVDKKNPTNEKCLPSIVDINTLPKDFLGRKIIIENSRPISKEELKDIKSALKRSYRDNIGSIFLNGDKLEMYDPIHINELLKIAGVGNEKELKNGYYSNKEIVWEVVRVTLIKKPESKIKALPVRGTIIVINMRLNCQYIKKLKRQLKKGQVPEYIKNELLDLGRNNSKNDTSSLSVKSGLYVCLGPAYIERGNNTTDHFSCSFQGHDESKSRVCFIIDDNAYDILGGKVCKMNGIEKLIANSCTVSLHYNVEIENLPEQYKTNANKNFGNLCRNIRSNLVGDGKGTFNDWFTKNYNIKNDIDINGYPDNLVERYIEHVNKQVHQNPKNVSEIEENTPKTQSKEETVCDDFKTVKVANIPIDQATVPNFIVDEKPAKVDQKSMLYNMYDENGIILRSLDSYGKPVYTPTEHFPISSSPLDIITNIYDYIIDSGLLTPEEVKTMNISLVSSFES